MTYNQVVKEIQTTLQNQPMIKEVMFQSPAQWLNNNYVPNFPSASFAINTGELNAGREQVFRIELWLLDKSGVDGEFEQEVTSDCHGIAYDIISILRQGFNKYLISTNITWEAISEKFEDYLSGVRLSFNLSIVRDYGACSVPTT